MKTDYLTSVIKQFEYYKMLGDKTLARLSDDQLAWQYNAESNSIITIVKHLHGNMLSRWTDFLNSDGEKEWRDRDGEFENEVIKKQQVLNLWEEGWSCLLQVLKSLNENDLERIVYIRNQGHSVTEAINRQLAHYPYHVGQIVFAGKMILNNDWESLSIPRGHSDKFNAEKFAKEKSRAHFTDEYLNKGGGEPDKI